MTRQMTAGPAHSAQAKVLCKPTQVGFPMYAVFCHSMQAEHSSSKQGWKNWADWLHQRNLKSGLYTSAGTTTCSSGGRILPIPGSYGHYAQDAQTFADWGVDYVKVSTFRLWYKFSSIGFAQIDWCGDELNNATQQHSEFSHALNATGRPIFLELCRGYEPPDSIASCMADGCSLFWCCFAQIRLPTPPLRPRRRQQLASDGRPS